jgi:formylglycine-generating enzyme required for sulfatase activity
LSNHPRERVSWYDAIAFCRWLTEKAQVFPQLLPEPLKGQAGCLIGLPTEWQWEKAARSPSTGKGYGREYPYQSSFDAAKANTSETGIEQTSAAGIFPNGASPYGALDLSGNVWEWCLNQYFDPEKITLSGIEARVLCGGSWRYDLDASHASLLNR